MERLLDDGLEVPNLLGASQLGESVRSGIAFPRDAVHFETFEIVNERLRCVIVVEQHYFLGLLCVSNISLEKL